MTIDYHALQERAIARARWQSTHGPAFPVNSCLLQCRTMFGIKQRIDTASDSWRASKDQHTKDQLNLIPRGVPVYWTGGSTGAGHIAISVGNGRCLSTDISRHGFFDEVPITEINRRWGSKLRFVGWSETLNGVRVWEKPTEVRKPPTPAPKPVVTEQTAYSHWRAAVLAADSEYGQHISVRHVARRRVYEAVAALMKKSPPVTKGKKK